MEFYKFKNLYVIVSMAMLLMAGAALFFSQYPAPKPASVSGGVDNYSTVVTQAQNEIPIPPPPPQKLSNPPAIIKAVYVTAYSASSRSYLNYLSNLFKNTEINAVVVDIKMGDGRVSYASDAPEVKKYNLDYDVVKNIDTLVRFFHDQNIYVIGRMVIFEDTAYAKARPDLAIYDTIKTTDATQPVLWQNKDGLSWLDPASKDVWDYNVSLAKDVFYHGFDEVNFDYARFPTDGDTSTLAFPKWDEKTPMASVIRDLLAYLKNNLPGEKISADLFGQTTTNKDDMGIGQLLENSFENVDYISPMVYPSHYINGFMGFANPADHPYEVVKYSLDSAKTREEKFLNAKQELVLKSNATQGYSASLLQAPAPDLAKSNLAKFRPWLQDFNLGAEYTPEMVEQEVKATEDALGSDFNGFMLWNASNIYTKEAVLKPR